MTPYRYAFTAIALAACQMAAAQAQQAVPVAPGTNLTTESAGPVVPASAVPAPKAGGAPASTEPRLIRGNDRVIAPAKAVPPIEGAPVSFNFEEAPVAEVPPVQCTPAGRHDPARTPCMPRALLK